MDPFGPEAARSAFRNAFGDFDRREKADQVEIHDLRVWYDSNTIIDDKQIVDGLLRSEAQARADGYSVLRPGAISVI